LKPILEEEAVGLGLPLTDIRGYDAGMSNPTDDLLKYPLPTKITKQYPALAGIWDIKSDNTPDDFDISNEPGDCEDSDQD